MATKKRISKKNKTPEPMPSLIFQNVKNEAPAQEKAPERPIFKPQPQPTVRGAKFWMWSGVGLFSITILLLWGWALKIRLDSFSWQKTPESKIINSAKTDWDKAFAETKALEENKKKIKDVLNQIVAGVTTTTTVSTSTPITTSTPRVTTPSTF